MWSNLTSVRGSKDTDIGHNCMKDFLARSTYIEDVCDMNTDIASTCVDNVNVVKRFGIYLQSSQNLKVRGARLEI